MIKGRFRDPSNTAVLLQIGAGIFTANALQPYRRWSEFRPTVENGVRAFLASRPENEHQQPFVGLTLRYINGFSSGLLGGMTANQFARDVLGFKITPPPAFQALYANAEEGSASANLLIPIANTAKTMNLQIGDGSIRPVGSTEDSPAAMLDMTVAETKPVAPTLEAVMACLDTSRDIIHTAFVDLTKPIHDRMKPQQGKSQ